MEILKSDEKVSYVLNDSQKIETASKQLSSDFVLQRPVIEDSKILNKEEAEVVEHSLKNQGRMLIHAELKPVKNDYEHDFDRGTVEYTAQCRNYSFHKVLISDGATIRDTNFSQKEPHTVAIEGKNLVFIDCNLVNVEIDPSWTLSGCNTSQIKRIIKKQEDILDDKNEVVAGKQKLVIAHQVEQDGKFVEVNEVTEIVDVAELPYKSQRFNAVMDEVTDVT